MLEMFLMEDAVGNDEKLARLGGFLSRSLVDSEPLRELSTLLELAKQTSAAKHLQLDPSLARGLSYYTARSWRSRSRTWPAAWAAGGRYDNLIGTFLGRDVPACGFSLGLERILVVMDERNMFPESVGGRSADVMVTLWDRASEGDALALAASLRLAGLRVDVYPEPDKLGKQFKYASSRAIPFVSVVGDDEKSAGTVTVKDLRSGEQMTVPQTDTAEHIKRRLDVDPDQSR